MSTYTTYIAIALFCVCALLGWLLKESYVENGEQRVLIQGQSEAIRKMNFRQVSYENILSTREAELNEVTNNRREFYEQLQESKQDKMYQDWDSSPLPDDVGILLDLKSN